MLFWHQKIWLGDGDRPGQSIYWDTKEKKAYIGESSKLVSAKKSKSNSLYAGIGVTSIIGIIGFCKLIGIRASSSDLSELWMVILTLAFSAGLIYFMNRFFYRRHTKYTEVTPVRARTAIKTHSFYGADWKALFILFPVMYIILGGFTILFIYGIVVDTLTGVLR